MRKSVLPNWPFTLIELLVVVAIIGILASMLLPALGRARAMAHRATCLNGAKQAHLGSMLYAEDYAEYLPSGTSSNGYQVFLSEGTYVPQEVFTSSGGCPYGQASFSASTGDPIRTGVHGYTPRVSYGLNGLLQTGYGKIGHGEIVSDRGGGWATYGPSKVSRTRLVEYPTLVATILCSPTAWDNVASQTGNWRPLWHALGRSQNGTWDAPNFDWLRHSGDGLPMVMFDGHGEFVRKDIITGGKTGYVIGGIPWNTSSSSFEPTTVMDYSFPYLYRLAQIKD